MTPQFEERSVAERMRIWRRKKRMLFLRRIGLLACAALILVLLVSGVAMLFSNEETAEQVEKPLVTTTTTQPTQPEKPTLIVDETVQEIGGFTDAQYAVLIDVTEGRVVAQKQADVRTYPASITKMMTLLVAVEQIEDLDATFEMSYAITDPGYLQGASMAGFKNEEQVRLMDMLYGCILPSGADATAGLAAVVAGSEEAFAELMNQRAFELGLSNTHFTNASGLHGDNHYTTAIDMALILMEAMKNPVCRQVLSTVEYTSASTPQNPEGLTWTSTMFSRMHGDQLSRTYEGYGYEDVVVIAGKTGYTTEAGHTMASYATGKDGHEYVIVTMDGSHKYKATYDHLNLLLRYVCGHTGDYYE